MKNNKFVYFLAGAGLAYALVHYQRSRRDHEFRRRMAMRENMRNGQVRQLPLVPGPGAQQQAMAMAPPPALPAYQQQGAPTSQPQPMPQQQAQQAQPQQQVQQVQQAQQGSVSGGIAVNPPQVQSETPFSTFEVAPGVGACELQGF